MLVEVAGQLNGIWFEDHQSEFSIENEEFNWLSNQGILPVFDVRRLVEYAVNRVRVFHALLLVNELYMNRSKKQ